GLLPRRCEDGCPVCLVNGSNMESAQLAPYVNSRRILRQIQEHLLVTSVPESSQPIRDLMDAKVVRVSEGYALPADLAKPAGTLQACTTYFDERKPVKTFVPAESIDEHGNSRPLSLFRE